MDVRLGFAAGCAAAALPRRQQRDLSPGYARGAGLARRIYWVKVMKGRSPNLRGTSTAGQSHRLTSGGKAEADGEVLGQSRSQLTAYSSFALTAHR
jgi:hypothetical protein